MLGFKTQVLLHHWGMGVEGFASAHGVMISISLNFKWLVMFLVLIIAH
ncbi:Uncharacterised protein [Cedecea neteri]|uniref:Uncharacterized protein n=1 Tax=Cedecea neteri TaxID=158822 RepID=A0A2X2TCX7_9ENTR|nr:Uncharacterised protein [Cedecea neteri]